jgi:hypothetical protein
MDYQNTMETQLIEIQGNEKRNKINEINEIGDEEILSGMINMVEEEYSYVYELMFPRSLRYSFIVLLYLNLNYILTKYCDSIKTKNNIPNQLKRLRGGPIAKANKYIHEIAAVPYIHKNIWDNIEDLSKIRNCIVHTSGIVKQSKDKTRLIYLSKKGIGLTIERFYPEENYLVLSDSYCKKALSDVSILIEELFNKANSVKL